jgi:hypothetical protein
MGWILVGCVFFQYDDGKVNEQAEHTLFNLLVILWYVLLICCMTDSLHSWVWCSHNTFLLLVITILQWNRMSKLPTKPLQIIERTSCWKFFLEKLAVTHVVGKFPPFIERRHSYPCSLKPPFILCWNHLNKSTYSYTVSLKYVLMLSFCIYLNIPYGIFP